MDTLLTVRQLQDLLRVDRVTIYRMLRRGELRAFKVGGQWRFPRHEVERWLHEQHPSRGTAAFLTLPEGGDAPPTQPLPLSCVQALQDIFADALDVAAVTLGPDGSTLSEVSNPCTFCDLILGVEEGRRRCLASWQRADDGKYHACHAGLLCLGTPVAVGGKRVATAVCCQFTAQAGSEGGEAWQASLPALAHDLDLTESALRAAAGAVRAHPESHLRRVSRLLLRLSETLSEMGQERLGLLGRLQRIAEMTQL
ncbi:MAG: PocR ligand-binding domain-containing protein [Anaerolineae bacterium]